MIRGLVIREATERDHDAIDRLLRDAFKGPAEARLVHMLREAGDDVLELVATHETAIVGHIFFSRLRVESRNRSYDAAALAPLAVADDMRRSGVGTALIDSAHKLLKQAGEGLSVVLGDPAYYEKSGYSHARAARFESAYQGPSLMALAFDEDAPTMGSLVYADAFSAL